MFHCLTLRYPFIFKSLFTSNKRIKSKVGLWFYYKCDISQSTFKYETPIKVSHLSGPKDKPLLDLTVGGTVERAASLFGDNEAIYSRHQAIRKTFLEVHQESSELAAGLLALGFLPGDRFGIWGPNSYEWYLTMFAAAKAGLILVNVNPAYKPNEIKYCINKVTMKGMIFADKFKTSNYYEMLREILPEMDHSTPGDLDLKETPSLKILISMNATKQKGVLNFNQVQEAGESGHAKEIETLSKKIQPQDPVNIQFTSGTTGLPKGALLSHHNIVNNAYFIGHRCGFSKKPLKICVPVPLYHCFGCVSGVLAVSLYGCSVVFPSAGFDSKEVVKTFYEEEINSCYGTPTMFVDILNEFRANPNNINSLLYGMMAGAPCPPELVNALIHELGMKEFIVAYGMTETSPVTFQCFPNDPPNVRSQTIGYPSDWVEVKIVDGNGNTVPIDQSGELWVKGYCNFLGYWDDTEKTSEILSPDGWLKTGDLLVLNEKGYASIRGRIKDMIIRGGENIYPAELENFYMSHPDIIEAQVFGVPDERMGEEVAMCLRLKSDSILEEMNLKEWSKEKIAHFKIPRYISARSEFPMTATGKIQKSKLRELAIKELGLKE